MRWERGGIQVTMGLVLTSILLLAFPHSFHLQSQSESAKAANESGLDKTLIVPWPTTTVSLYYSSFGASMWLK